MGDSTTDKIDRFFNVADAVIEETGKILGRANQSSKAAGQVVREARDANPRPMPPQGATPAAAKRSSSKVRIIESIDAQSGATVFVVTDGVSRSECSSRALADRVARAMEVE